MIRERIEYHYSEYGSKCSDYELAQYVLYYLQAAQLFGDEEKVLKEMIEFKVLEEWKEKQKKQQN